MQIQCANDFSFVSGCGEVEAFMYRTASVSYTTNVSKQQKTVIIQLLCAATLVNVNDTMLFFHLLLPYEILTIHIYKKFISKANKYYF